MRLPLAFRRSRETLCFLTRIRATLSIARSQFRIVDVISFSHCQLRATRFSAFSSRPLSSHIAARTYIHYARIFVHDDAITVAFSVALGKFAMKLGRFSRGKSSPQSHRDLTLGSNNLSRRACLAIVARTRTCTSSSRLAPTRLCAS